MAADTLLREPPGSAEDIEDEGGQDERKLARLIIGSRILRRRRMRNLLLAHLLREGREGDDQDEEGGGEEGGGEDRRVLRLLVAGGLLRRRRMRRLLLARLLRQRRAEADVA
jgi:hypothetical protein